MGNSVNIYLTADHIISALGYGTDENVEAVRNYRSGITLHTDGAVADSPIMAARIDNSRLEPLVVKHGLESYTRLEQLFILSIGEVIAQHEADLNTPDCCFLFSTTKGNIDLLSGHTEAPLPHTSLWGMAERIMSHLRMDRADCQIISNACISGVSALVIAKRWMEEGKYRKVIVSGADVLSHFITSGFVSFKSVSEAICRPFDSRRDGLSLGEGCGTLLLTTQESANSVILAGGGISNDANHISGPSRTGDGLYHAIRQAMNDAQVGNQEISFVNTHGTATLYNDEMESKAIHLAGLQAAPVNSMKSYFGHTLGAAGVIETILCARELKEQTLFGTYAFETLGVSMPIQVFPHHRAHEMSACVKTASGFGGCNAAVVMALPNKYTHREKTDQSIDICTTATVTIKESNVVLNDQLLFSSTETSFAAFIREAYKILGEGNMKFYKMDDLCKLGYIACHHLLNGLSYLPTEAGIVLANSSSSLHSDLKHQELIDQGGDSAASPAVFVYTLPNVVAGEICIRYKIQGENTFFVKEECDWHELEAYARIAMQRERLKLCIVGWCELVNDEYLGEFRLLRSNLL